MYIPEDNVRMFYSFLLRGKFKVVVQLLILFHSNMSLTETWKFCREDVIPGCRDDASAKLFYIVQEIRTQHVFSAK